MGPKQCVSGKLKERLNRMEGRRLGWQNPVNTRNSTDQERTGSNLQARYPASHILTEDADPRGHRMEQREDH